MAAGHSHDELAACTDFKERQNLRGALRELKGIKLDGDPAVTYSFSTKSARKTSPLTSPKPENGRVFPKQTNYKSVDENSFLERKYNRITEKVNIVRARNRRIANDGSGKYVTAANTVKIKRELTEDISIHKTQVNGVQERKEDDTPNKFERIKSNFEKSAIEKSKSGSNVKEILSESFRNRVNDIKSTFERHRSEKPKFRSYLYAGNLTTPTNQLEEDTVIPVQRCVSVSVVSSNEITNNSDKQSVIKRSVSSLALNGSHNHPNESHNETSLSSLPPKPDVNQSPRKPRKISYRNSAFSQSSQVNQISSSVSQGKLQQDSGDVDSVSDQVSRIKLSELDHDHREAVPNQTANQIASNPNIKHPVTKSSGSHRTGRHSVPILIDSQSVPRDTGSQSNTRTTGKLAVRQENGAVVDNTDEQLISKTSGRRFRSGLNSARGQSNTQLKTKLVKKETQSDAKSTIMKAETFKRHSSESSIAIQNLRNELNNAQNEEAKRIRSKSQGCHSDVTTSENIMEVSLQKKKAALSRKNRVDSTDSTKTVRKYRRKTHTDDEPLTSPNTPQPNDIIMSPVNGEHHTKPAHGHKQSRRKLPEIPVFSFEHEAENDETVHERTIRLLQERRKGRLGKIIKEKEIETKPSKSTKVTPEQIKTLQDKLERSDSKRKACRVRRELQLLNRETKLKSPVPVKLEAEFSAILKAGEAVIEKDNVHLPIQTSTQLPINKRSEQLPIQRSQSDVGRKPAKMEFEVSCREPVKEVKVQRSSTVQEVDHFLSQPLTPDKKIDLIGRLMQEEAKLQEMLRRSTSFTDKRNIRAEVKQIREKRNAIEGASVPVATLQRSASVSSGVITHASTPEGNRVTEPDVPSKQPTLDELRKQLNETTDYDEKKKIRLALRQLRQQAKDGTPTQTGLQRSQSFVHQKTSDRQIETQSGSVPVFRHRSVSESKLQPDDQSIKPVTSKTVSSEPVYDKKSLGQSESENDHHKSDLTSSKHSHRSGRDFTGPSRLSNKPPVPLPHKQTTVANGDARIKSVEAGSLPPRAPKRHSFSAGTELKLGNQTNSFSDGSQRKYSADSGSDAGSRHVSSRPPSEVSTKVSEKQPSVQSNDTKFKSKFANILVSRSYLDRRKSASDIISEPKLSTSTVSHDNKSLIRSETTSFRVTDTETKAHKSHETLSVKTDIDTDSRLTPNIEWLEDKKRTIPTPNELDKLMSSMDIEAAFSQILDAVETEPTNGDLFDTQVPDTPIMEEESESSTSSVAELTNIIAESKHKMEESKQKMDGSKHDMDESKHKMDEPFKNGNIDTVTHNGFSEDFNENSRNIMDDHNDTRNELEDVDVKTVENHKDIHNERGDKSVPKQSDEIIDVNSEKQNGDLNDEEAVSGKDEGNSNGAIDEEASNVKSTKKIQLHSDLSLDVSQPADTSSAISVIHGDDGTVTVQEVNRIEEGDTVITELKKVHRSHSRSETRETDTIVEKKVTTPGGTSQTYEKDVSKTKRKITSRGSEYFSRNHYNIRKRKDLAGEEIVEHELDSESANVSVSKNESWGERSEAKVILNRDGTNEILPRRLSITKNNSDGKSEIDSSTDKKMSSHPLERLSAGTKTSSSGHGSVSPTVDDHDLAAVVEAHLGRPSGCPEITSPLQNVTSTEGDTAVLEFKCKGHPEPELTWYKGDNLLAESDTIHFLFDGVSGKAQLEIHPVSRGDLGDYKCVVKNSLGTASTSGRLNVKNKTSTLPWFQTKLNDVSVTEGQSITLECEVSDVDKVMWFKDGIIQRNSPDLRQTFDGKVARLEIIEVYLDDDGTYSCVISNKMGENGCSCKIAVNESQSKDSIVPLFLRKLDTQICNIGDTTILETEVIGSPEPTVTWYINRNRLTEPDCHLMEYDGRIARLVLQKIGLSQGGKLECVAENSSGRVSCDCLLVVQEVKLPPVLTNQLSNVTFTCGKAAILECTVESASTPDIAWRKNGFVIGQMLDFKQTFIDGVARLEIGNACTQDSGKYDCVIKNPHGEVITSSFLTIQDDVPKQEEPKLATKEVKSEVSSVRTIPASFTPKVDNERKHQAKSSASKVMLVRQASLRSMNREPQTSILKRTASFNAASLTKGSAKQSSELKQSLDNDCLNSDDGLAEQNKVKVSEKTVIDKSGQKNEIIINKNTEPEKVNVVDVAPTDITKTKLSTAIGEVKESGLENITDDKVDLNKNYTKDVNSNITKAGSNNEGAVLEDKNKSLKLELQLDSNKPSQTTNTGQVVEKNELPADKKTVSGVSKGMSFGAADKSPLSRFKSGGELRRTQSTKTPGSEKPEWLQVKLRKVTNTPLTNTEKQSIEKNANFNAPSEKTTPVSTQSVSTELSNTPVSVPKEVKLSRSQSARVVVDRKKSPVLKDSTNSPSNDPSRKTVKLTPVSERAKMFLANERSSSPSGKSSPTDIIAKAINLSRTESLRSPIGQRPFVVQRSGSFKAEARASQPGNITLNLKPQASKGEERAGDSNSPRQTIEVWDPTAPPSTKMDISKITDEEELTKMLNGCENFEERKKLRARIKELREVEYRAMDAKRAEREKNQEDAIKLKHKEADAQKQRRLDQFAEQAKTQHDSKKVDIAEQHIREKYKQADIDKQKRLEAFDKLARKDDVKQTSTVSTEVSTDGKTTTTTRKVATTTSVTGRGATGRPAEDIAPQMVKQFLHATSPSVSGQLSVKTESWSSKDGVTRTSEKTESWGAKPVNPFKAADAANAKTNPPTKPMARSPSAIKTLLLDWCKAMTREYKDKIIIENFSTSWNDGVAFCALIHHFYPESFDFYALDPKQRRKNFELAFDTAEKYADIAPLLDVEDMVRMKKPDWKCVFCYVQSFYRKLQTHEKNKAATAEA